MIKKIANFPLVILAGGKSSRMGHPKGLVKLFDKTLLEHNIEQYIYVYIIVY